MSKGKKDQMNSEEALTDNDTLIMETLYGSTYFPVYGSPQWIPKPLSLPPKSYLIFVGDDPNNAFIYPAREMEKSILSGNHDYDGKKDKVELVYFHEFEDMNAALQSNKNIYAMFIYAHSLRGAEGFTANTRIPERKYNIGRNEKIVNSMPVSMLYSANMMRQGLIYLYSCHAALSVDGDDIAHAMARQFGVIVYASSTGVSLCPLLADDVSKKTSACTNPFRWYTYDNFGFFQGNPPPVE